LALGRTRPAAGVFRENSRAFVNLSLYEQRLQRTLKESLRQLQELQALRRANAEAAAEAKAAVEAEAKRNMQKTNA
jgi:hypothetical protein